MRSMHTWATMRGLMNSIIGRAPCDWSSCILLYPIQMQRCSRRVVSIISLCQLACEAMPSMFSSHIVFVIILRRCTKTLCDFEMERRREERRREGDRGMEGWKRIRERERRKERGRNLCSEQTVEWGSTRVKHWYINLWKVENRH